MAKFTVAIDPEQCKGCRLCIHFCKHRVLAAAAEVNRRGYHCAAAEHPEQCRGCLNCYLICPDMAVTIHKED
ncbi:MAG: 4Fe-4S dicluster domain-containing protein [Planctomycetota bacterium]